LVSDVAGGFTLGLAYLLLAIWVVEAFPAPALRRAALNLGRKRRGSATASPPDAPAASLETP
jgi:hypothetical protein